MPTVKEMEKELKGLREQIIKLRSSNSNLLDEVHHLKSTYSKLVDHVNNQFQAVNDRFL